jgi:hypothetical protein
MLVRIPQWYLPVKPEAVGIIENGSEVLEVVPEIIVEPWSEPGSQQKDRPAEQGD